MRVLAVEDDPIVGRIEEAALKNLGHEVTRARDGEQAWTLFNSQPFPVVISDWFMPKLDGLGLCERIRRAKSETYPYFILLTSAENSNENLAKAMRAGVDDFLLKPLDLTGLVTRLHVAERIRSHIERIGKLEHTLLTICAWTKRIKVGENRWVNIDEFLHEQLGFELTHGMSPEAVLEVRAEMERADKPDPFS